jgi:MoaA/NifB/PqqE/SkfB family radical SAM enzyme
MSHNQVESRYRDPRRNVEINVGKVCNNKCVFCLDGQPSKEDHAFMPFDAMKLELERWRAEGHLSVGFLGGEPTTYPKIIESVQHAKDLGFTRIALATNAMMLRRMPFLDKLLDAGLTRATVSMHGHTKELEDKLVLVPGAYEKKCQALRNLKQRQREGKLADGVSVNIVLNGWNYKHLPQMMRFFFEDMALDDLRVNFVRPEGFAENNSDLTQTYTDTIKVLMKAVLLNEEHFKRVFTFGGIPMCMLPERFLGSEPLLRKYMGDIYRDLSTDCSIRSAGTSGVEGTSTIEGGRARFNWQDRKRFDLKHHMSGCARCAHTDLCEGVWRGYLEIYGESEFSPLQLSDDGRYVREAPRLKQAPTPVPMANRGGYRRHLPVVGIR